MLPEQIAAAARTVVHLSQYFTELKGRAEPSLQAAQAQRRGYFTPSEDEAVRHLLVSYWQSRNALFDLVISFRDDTSLSAELRPAAFLVAFAASTLLVDAARFMREAFEGRSIVRDKLNEPEPYFGIPAGTYDAVQKSLTSPRHAWHLYHALKYYAAHQAELRALAAGGELAPVLAVVETLGGRLDVPALRYAKARLRFRAAEAAGRLRRDLVGQSLYGMQKLVSSLAAHVYVRPGHRPALPAAIADQIRQLARPGDVMITRKEYAITNYFLPGYWPHAALYLGDGPALEQLGIDRHDNVRPRWVRLLEPAAPEPRRVLEAMADGVRIRELTSPMGCDSLAILRPRLSTADVAEALARGLFHEGKPYDFDFDFTRSDRLVCTEVVYRAYEGIGGVRFELSRRAGRLVLSAGDLLAMALDRNHFEPVAVYAPTYSAELLQGPPAEELFKQKRVTVPESGSGSGT